MTSYYLCNTEIFGLSKSTVKIYTFLRMVRNTITDNSFYGKRKIAAQCNVSISTVTRAIRELRAKNLLEVQIRFEENGRQTSNRYILLDNPQTQITDKEPNESSNNRDDINNESMPQSFPRRSQTSIRLFRCAPASLKVNLAPTAVKVYAYLSFRAGKDGRCKPSKREIASDCKISVSTVTRALRQLRNNGLISIIPQTRQEVFGNNGKSVNLYILNPDISVETAQKEKPMSHRCFWVFKILMITLLRLFDTLPHIISDTPRTISRTKVTDNLRVKSIFSKLAKRNIGRPPYFFAGLGKCLSKNE